MDIVEATDFSEVIAMLKRSRRRVLSFNQIATRLGFKSPRTIAMVFKKQRAPSATLVRSICDYLQLTEKECDFMHWLAEKSRREMKGSPSVALEEKINRFRAMRSITVEARSEIAGVLIEISPSAPESVSRRLREIVRELTYEINRSKIGRVATESIASAIDPAACPDPAGEKDRGCC